MYHVRCIMHYAEVLYQIPWVGGRYLPLTYGTHNCSLIINPYIISGCILRLESAAQRHDYQVNQAWTSLRVQAPKVSLI